MEKMQAKHHTHRVIWTTKDFLAWFLQRVQNHTHRVCGRTDRRRQTDNRHRPKIVPNQVPDTERPRVTSKRHPEKIHTIESVQSELYMGRATQTGRTKTDRQTYRQTDETDTGKHPGPHGNADGSGHEAKLYINLLFEIGKE